MEQMVTGVVLAGGSSRRMGRDKAMMPLQGRPIIERIIRIMDGIFERTIIIAQAHQDFSLYGRQVVHDLVPGFGALMGLYTGLKKSPTWRVLAVACDMPFIQPGLLSYMCSVDHPADVIVPKINGHFEPLLAIYSKSCLPAIEELIGKSDKSILSLYPKVTVREITQEEIELSDPEQKSFIKINTRQEYFKSVGN
jgi:molybdopterin-guanine dinucleotide biosynthesis protein A